MFSLCPPFLFPDNKVNAKYWKVPPHMPIGLQATVDMERLGRKQERFLKDNTSKTNSWVLSLRFRFYVHSWSRLRKLREGFSLGQEYEASHTI